MSPPTQTGTRTLIVCLLVLAAGCSALPGGGESTTGLSIANQDDVEHAVVVEIGQITDSPDPAYTGGRTVDGESTVELAPFQGSGTYHVDVTVDGNTTRLTYVFESGTSSVTIGIDDQGVVTLEP